MNTAFYFNHDYNARNDQKVLELRSEFGWVGYAIFFALLESLCEARGYIKREALGGLSVGFNHPKEELLKIVDFCLKVELFYEDENGFYSNRILQHLAHRKILSVSGSMGGRPRKKPPLSQPEATPKLREERKGKEIKGKENINALEVEFIKFHQSYPGSKNRTHEVHWEVFKKKFGKQAHEIVPKLMENLKRQVYEKELQERVDGFSPRWQMLQTYINQQSWNRQYVAENKNNGLFGQPIESPKVSQVTLIRPENGSNTTTPIG